MSPFTRTNKRSSEEEDFSELALRFGIAQDAGVDDIEERQAAQIEVRAAIYEAAKAVYLLPGNSRTKSLALTDLESALMWAGKHIFTVNVEEEPDVAPIDRPGVVSDARDFPWAEGRSE